MPALTETQAYVLKKEMDKHTLFKYFSPILYSAATIVGTLYPASLVIRCRIYSFTRLHMTDNDIAFGLRLFLFPMMTLTSYQMYKTVKQNHEYRAPYIWNSLLYHKVIDYSKSTHHKQTMKEYELSMRHYERIFTSIGYCTLFHQVIVLLSRTQTKPTTKIPIAILAVIIGMLELDIYKRKKLIL